MDSTGTTSSSALKLPEAQSSTADDETEVADHSTSESESGEATEETHEPSHYSRKKIASNAWRYEEPEPEPGAGRLSRFPSRNNKPRLTNIYSIQ